MKPSVAIAGAGPTGLALALWLTRLGVGVRIFDPAPEPGTTSRALVVHARILEHYAQLGLAEPLIALGTPMRAVNLWVGGRRRARMDLGDMGAGLSPYPYALICPQDAHERFLIDVLEREGVRVERGASVTAYRETPDGVSVRVEKGRRAEDVDAMFLAGCDGAHSVVRKLIDAGFPGGTYEHMFYVADVQARGDLLNQELHVALDYADFFGAFPLVEPGHVRLVGMIRDVDANSSRTYTWEDVNQEALARMPLKVEKVNWFSTYHVHHRVAGTFRRGRAFLLGDAGHIHSPVGGQGMNTGIGDAVNLSWKLAGVLHADWPPTMLDSYGCERRAFAERLVASTDRAFTFVTRNGALARFVRLHLVPVVVPRFFSTRTGRRVAWRTLSQTGIHYRHCPLSAGQVNAIHGGDRLPWVRLRNDPRGDNYAPLKSLRWQMHVYGRTDARVRRHCERHRFELHTFKWHDDMARAGFTRDAFYLVRPDGYIASASRTLDLATK